LIYGFYFCVVFCVMIFCVSVVVYLCYGASVGVVSVDGASAEGVSVVDDSIVGVSESFGI
ncbi:MAG: hypothetical protein AB8B55_03020, partial [Mariniblastus sp.]